MFGRLPLLRRLPDRGGLYVSPVVLVLALGAGELRAECAPLPIEDGSEITCTGPDPVTDPIVGDASDVRINIEDGAALAVTGDTAIFGEGKSWLLDIQGLVSSDQTAIRLDLERDDPDDPSAGPVVFVLARDDEDNPADGQVISTGTSDTDHAIHLSGDRGVVSNSGLIEAAGGHAVWLQNSGSVTSNGVIELLDGGTGWAVLFGDEEGVLTNSCRRQDGECIAGTGVIRSGVDATGAVSMGDSSTLNNNTGALIEAAAGTAVHMAGGQVANAGTIEAADGQAVRFDDGAQLLNQSAGEILAQGDVAVSVAVDTTVDPEDIRAVTLENRGLISGELGGVQGLDMDVVTLTNSGAIESTDGIAVELTGTEGTITNAADAVLSSLNGDALVTNLTTVLNEGLIEAAGTGVDLSGDGRIDNQGQITAATGEGVILRDDGYLANHADAIVSGGLHGVVLAGAGASLDNLGAISAENDAALRVENAAGSVTNYGLIEREGGGTAVHFDGDFENLLTNAASGEISGDVLFDVDTAAHGVANFGTITGNVTLGDGDAEFVLGSTGMVDGDISLGAGTNRFDFHSGGEVDGVISAGGSSTLKLLDGAAAVGTLGDTSGFESLVVDAAGTRWEITADQAFSGELDLLAGELDLLNRELVLGAASTLGEDATLALQVNQDESSFGRLNLNGQALDVGNSAVLLVDPDAGDWGGPAQSNFTFQLFENTDFDGTTFERIEAGFFAIDDSDLYSSGELTLQRDFANQRIATSTNRQTIGQALNAVSDADDMSAELQAFRDELLGTRGDAAAGRALDDLGGEVHAAQNPALFRAADAFRGSLRARSEALRVAARSDSVSPVQVAATGTRGVFAPEEYVELADADHRAWARGFHTRGTLDGNDGAADADYRISGLSVGYDQAAGENWRLGAAFGLGSSRTERNGTRDQVNVDNLRLAGYGLYTRGNWNVDVLAGGAWLDFDSRRDIVETDTVVEADYNGSELFAGIDGGYTAAFFDDGFLLRPSLGMDWSRISRDSFDEDVAGSLDVKSGTTSRLEGSVRLEAALPRETANGTRWTPTLRTGYVRDLQDDGAEINARFVGDNSGQSFTVRGADAGRDRFEAGAGVVLRAAQDLQLFADYDYHRSSGQEGHTISLGLRQHW